MPQKEITCCHIQWRCRKFRTLKNFYSYGSLNKKNVQQLQTITGLGRVRSHYLDLVTWTQEPPSNYRETVLSCCTDEDPMLQKKDLLSIWSFLVSLHGLVFLASLQLISTYWVLVFGYVQNISIQKICMSHLLWWCCILLCFVMEMYGKWLDNTKCTEDVSWFNQMLLQNIRQLCNICCALNFPDCWPSFPDHWQEHIFISCRTKEIVIFAWYFLLSHCKQQSQGHNYGNNYGNKKKYFILLVFLFFFCLPESSKGFSLWILFVCLWISFFLFLF